MPEDKKLGGHAPGPLSVRDIISPPAIEVDFDHLKIGDRYFRTLFVAGYPRFVTANWLEPLVSFNHTLDISMYIYPTKSEEVLDNLKRKVGEMEATIQSDMKRGRVIEPSIQVALEDALSLQQELAKGAERFFQFGLYVTIPATSLEDLNKTTKQVEATLASLLILTKKAVLQMEEGLKTTLPMGTDRIMVTRNMDTTSLATTFPFTSSELTANEGILYGINEHNDSLVIFDRFSLENANMTIFGKSVAKWEPLLVRQNGTVAMSTIGDTIESLIKRHGITYKDEVLEGVRNPDLEVFTYDRALHGHWAKVHIAARKPFSQREKLYKITTRSGREITVTADHSLVVLRDGQIRSMRGQAVRVGEAVPLARSVPEQKEAPTPIVPKEFVAFWPKELPSQLPISSAFLTLLGLATSEGLVRVQALNIYNRDPHVLHIVADAAATLGARIAPRYNGQKIICGYNIQPNAFAKLFVALGAGGKSGEKRVPGFIFSLPNASIAAYLCAYFEGDGTVSKTDVSCTSKSKLLISDLAYLLLRFGIIGRIKGKHKRATNAKSPGDTYYQLTISGGDHLKRFAASIGFLTETKNKKRAVLLGKPINTNVDTIPTLGPTLQRLATMLYTGDQVRMPTNLSPLKRGIFAPSPQELNHIIMAARSRINQLKKLREQMYFLKHLPSLETLIARGAKNKRLNKALWKELGYSWQLMKTGRVTPGAVNVLRAYKTITGETIALSDIKTTIYETFRDTGTSLQRFNNALWSTTVLEARRPGDIAYPTIEEAVCYVFKRYRSIQLTIRHAEKILKNLERLATADLFWDPIVSIERIKHHEQYVYDLTVDNEVFLTGNGGLFVHNSGSGKSYLVKLELMRSLMFDTEVIVIDPENEYEALTHALGGEYIRFHFGTTTKINPFDLALLHQREESREAGSRSAGESELNQKILSLHGFFRVVMGKLTPTEDALLDRALILAYQQKGITPDPATQNREPPLMEDLYKSLIGMEEPMARGLADRIEKFVKGSLVGIFDAYTNVEIRNPLTVFSIRDLEEELRPIAMYLILDFIWTKIRRDTRRRMLVVDEAWYMMKYPDSGAFLNSIAKRARKYYLGVTTITQDVEDFLSVDLGKAIIQNSSLQILLKQSTAAIDKVADIFYLSEGEKHLLLAADIGEGLFFAGPAHAAVRVIASPEEHELATTKPQELEAQRRQRINASARQGEDIKQKPQDLTAELSEPELPAPAKRPSISPPPPFAKATAGEPNRPIFTVETINNDAK